MVEDLTAEEDKDLPHLCCEEIENRFLRNLTPLPKLELQEEDRHSFPLDLRDPQFDPELLKEPLTNLVSTLEQEDSTQVTFGLEKEETWFE